MLQATTKAEFSTEYVPKADRFMASKFFHVHHEFRVGKSQQWWETAHTAMAPGGGWDDAVAKNLEAGFTTIRSVLLALKVLPSASGKSARESQQRNFRNSSMALMA